MAAALATAIVLGYAGSLWWLLRRESAAPLGGLVVLCAVALGLRLAWYSDYPRGLYQDEPLFLQVAMRALRDHRIFGEAQAVGVPALLGSLFEAQLVPFVGAGRWAIRSYSMATSVLAVAAAFALARAVGLRRLPSLAAAAFVAVLPWSVFYGRIHWGGELVLHQLLLLAALARLIWGGGSWAEVAIGSFALCLLVYDYWAGHAMLGMPLVAAVLAVGYRRWLCVCILAVAVAAQIAYFNTHPPPQWNFRSLATRDLSSQPTTVPQRLLQTLDTFLRPSAYNYLASIQSAALHPPLLLLLAALGLGLALVTAPRRGLFLAAGFLGGLTPALFTSGPPSTHRMLMGFAFVTLAAATALDEVPWRRWRTPLIVAVVALIGVHSVRLYFSPEFWPRDTRKLFDWERSEVVDALPAPPHPFLVVTPQFGEFMLPHALVDRNQERLSVENWYPPRHDAVLYAFEWRAGPLQSFYADLFGWARLQTFGRGFLVRLEATDWSWLRVHGWAYTSRCNGDVLSGQVPALFQPGWMFQQQISRCFGTATTHTWRGRWNGPATPLQLYFSGTVTIDTGAQILTDSGFEKVLHFVAQPDSVLTIQIENLPTQTLLAEVLDLNGDAPRWSSVSPVDISDCGSFTARSR